MKIDPRRLIDIVHIAEQGSYARAAEVRGVSQPALTSIVQNLEQALGVKLFDRGAHGAKPTKYGDLLLVHAHTVRAVLERASAEIELNKKGLVGSLVVGVSPVACVSLLPAALARLKSIAPLTSVAIEEGNEDTLLSRLRSGDIDLMVSSAGIGADPADVQRRILAHDSFAVMMNPKHRLRRKRSLSLADLRDCQWVMPNPEASMYRQIELVFASESETWPINAITSNSITTIRSLLLKTEFVTISSRHMMGPDIESGAIAAVPLARQDFKRDIVLRYRRVGLRTPLANRFIELLAEVSPQEKPGR